MEPSASDPSKLTYTSSLVNAWRSANLVYRGIEDDAEDKEQLWLISDGDPPAIAMQSMRYVAPTSKANMGQLVPMSKDLMLRVFICLPLSNHESQEEGDKTDGKEKDKKQKRPKPVGMLLMWPSFKPFTHHRSGTLGIGLAPEHRGKGYGREALNWAIDWGFNHAGLHRVALSTFEYNERAIRLYKSLGFVEEGRERKAMFFERKWWDVVCFSILEGEWEKLRGIS